MTTATLYIEMPRAKRRVGAAARLHRVAMPVIALVGTVALVMAVVVSVALAERVATSAALFVLAVAAEAAIWWAGAVRARRTIRLLGPTFDQADRAACADLNARLERESR